MAEDRMLNDEILLGLIKANSGGGGTTDYDALSNKPQIAGTTLSGNKSLADLGIASATDLAAKQDALTAGDYIQFDGNEISVNRNIEVDNVDYNIEYRTNNSASITKSKDGQVISTQNYDWGIYETSIDGLFNFGGASSSIGFVWRITLIKDSTTHSAGYSVDFKTNDTTMDVIESFPEQDVSGYKLVIKSEMDTALAGKQNTLTFDDTPTDGSNNPVKSNGIYDALATKQNATDNSLQTTDKTVVGAINEHEGDIVSLKSGLTTLETEVNGDATTYPYADVITIPDAVPANLADCSVKVEPIQDLHGQSAPYVGGAGKNKLPLVLADLKTANTDGTWNDNVYTVNNGTITVNTDDGGNVTSIKANGTFNANTRFWLAVGYANTKFMTDGVDYTINGCPDGGSSSTYKIQYSNDVDASVDDVGSGATFQRYADTFTGQSISIVLYSGAAITNAMFYPMIRLATETDATFAPYTNLCPISGHTEASVQRDGFNIWNGTATDGKAISNDGGTYNSENNFVTGYVRVFPNVKYYINGTNWENWIGVYKSDRTHIENVRVNTSDRSVIFSENAHFARFTGKLPNKSTACINMFDSALNGTYEPYAGQTYTLALGDTIYGGTVDFNTGVMTVDRAIAVFDGSSDENWRDYQSYSDNSHLFDISGWGTSNNAKTESGIANQYTRSTSLAYNPNSFRIVSGLNVRANFNSLQDWKTHLETTPLQICYELATPTTIQLTPTQIQLLKGQNTLTASTGDISVTVNGVSGAIGQVQSEVNEIAEDVVDITTAVATKQDKLNLGVTASDLNTVDTGCCITDNTTTNSPDSSSAFVVFTVGCVVTGYNFRIQFAIKHIANESTTGELYVRKRWGANWSPWSLISFASN